MSRSDALPGVLAEIEAVAGRDAALEIALRFGGTDIYVSARGSHARAIVEAVGARAWAAIVARLGGETVHVPLARRALVRHLGSQGVGTAEIARRLHITRRTARRYRREGA